MDRIRRRPPNHPVDPVHPVKNLNDTTVGSFLLELVLVLDRTRQIRAIQEGRPEEAEALLPVVYAKLRRIAASRMAQEAPGNTLQPTALALDE